MKYTIEQVEYLRTKADITYEEAVEILEKYQGDVAKCLVELEKIGKIRNNTYTNNNNSNQNSGEEFKKNVKKVYNNSVRHRFIIKKGDTVIVNLSLLYMLAALIVAPHLTIVSAIAAIFLGYKINIQKEETDDYEVDLKEQVNKAAGNIKNTVKDFTEVNVQKAEKAETNTKDGYNEITVE